MDPPLKPMSMASKDIHTWIYHMAFYKIHTNELMCYTMQHLNCYETLLMVFLTLPMQVLDLRFNLIKFDEFFDARKYFYKILKKNF